MRGNLARPGPERAHAPPSATDHPGPASDHRRDAGPFRLPYSPSPKRTTPAGTGRTRPTDRNALTSHGAGRRAAAAHRRAKPAAAKHSGPREPNARGSPPDTGPAPGQAPLRLRRRHRRDVNLRHVPRAPRPGVSSPDRPSGQARMTCQARPSANGPTCVGPAPDVRTIFGQRATPSLGSPLSFEAASVHPDRAVPAEHTRGHAFPYRRPPTPHRPGHTAPAPLPSRFSDRPLALQSQPPPVSLGTSRIPRPTLPARWGAYSSSSLATPSTPLNATMIDTKQRASSVIGQPRKRDQCEVPRSRTWRTASTIARDRDHMLHPRRAHLPPKLATSSFHKKPG